MRQFSIFLRILFAMSVVFSIITFAIATIVFINTLPAWGFGMIPNLFWFATQLVVPLGISAILYFAAKKAAAEALLFSHIQIGKRSPPSQPDGPAPTR